MFSYRNIFHEPSPEQSVQKPQFSASNCLKKLIEYGKGNSNEFLIAQQIIEICKKSKNIIQERMGLLHVYAPFKVMGMIKGHFRDLIKMFDIFGHPDKVNYIFLGGYISKNQQSIQTLCLLLLYKILHPSSTLLIRGSDESEEMTVINGFKQQCQERYGLLVWKYFCEVFCVFPLGVLIQGKILCIHGGLSPHIIHMQDINSISNTANTTQQGLLCDLLWSDPHSNDGFKKNSKGFSYSFGRDAIEKFLYVNNLDLIVRSHQLRVFKNLVWNLIVHTKGYQLMFENRLMTLCSAPNCEKRYRNDAAILVVNQGLKCELQIYHPSNSTMSEDK